ncbi:tryptophan aminotransferase-related protein 3-like protein [Tanacetum coccineum]
MFIVHGDLNSRIEAFLDGPVYEGEPICECYGCYGGLDCSELNPGCGVDADSGDPIFMEPSWIQNAASSAVVISGWHRMSYRYADNTVMSIELEKFIHKLHPLVGNAITEGRYLVFGVGSAQLLNAAVYALSSQNSSSPSNVIASIPYFSLYKDQTVLLNSKDFQFQGDSNLWQSNNSTHNTDVIEFVTSPNNPDGELKEPIIGGNTIYDHAYLWPHFTPIMGPSDHDLMIFTLSKLTGHAGHPLQCNFFNETRLPSPAYVWVKCEREEEDDCGVVLNAGNIIGRSGSNFSAKDRYVRLSLIKSQDDFELLLQRLTELVSLENGSVNTV